jgi:transposase
LSKPYRGTYFLRTDRHDLGDDRIWSLYVMLTIVEDAFRCLKSDLGLRPNFHHKPDRIEGHLFITVLAYHVLHYIRYKLNKAGLFHRWPTIKSWLNTHRIIITNLPRKEGGVIHVRHGTTPTLKQQEVYAALKMTGIPLRQKKVTT